MNHRVLELFEDTDDDDDDVLLAWDKKPTIQSKKSIAAPATTKIVLTPLGSTLVPAIFFPYARTGQKLQLVKLPNGTTALYNAKGEMAAYFHDSVVFRVRKFQDECPDHKVELTSITKESPTHVRMAFAVRENRRLSKFELNPRMRFIQRHLDANGWTLEPFEAAAQKPAATPVPVPSSKQEHPQQVPSSSLEASVATVTPEGSRKTTDKENFNPAVVQSSPEAVPSSVSKAGPKTTGEEEEEEVPVQNPTAEANVELTHVDWSDKNDQLDEMFEEQMASQLNGLPEHPVPKALKIKLYPHQLQGIRWLIHRETNLHKLPPWFENRHGFWHCSISETKQRLRPPTLSGMILGDDMGLGKTVQTLGLILARPPPPLHQYPYQAIAVARQPLSPRTTLIVAPLSVLSNWEMEIENYVNRNRKKGPLLTVKKYHGPNRGKVLDQVKANLVDIMLVSYHTLAADLKSCNSWHTKPDNDDFRPATKKRRPKLFIFELEFHRVILDEAHIIRSAKSGFFKSCRKLKTRRRLCLTGTPYVNRPGDLHSLLSFLEVHPLCNHRIFKDRVLTPIAEARECGLAVVRTTLAHICLRRTKDVVRDKVQLVPKKVHKSLIKFIDGSVHKQIHDELYHVCKCCFEGMLNVFGTEGVLEGANFMRVVTLVLRVRQACCHSSLVPDEVLDSVKSLTSVVNRDPKDFSEEEVMSLLDRINGVFEDNPSCECAVCLETLEPDQTAILRGCQHVFCAPCLNKISNHLCPLCRQTFSPEDVLSKKRADALARPTKKKKRAYKDSCRSPKVQAMLNIMEEMKPDEKGVIFSQWTTMLDIIQKALHDNGYTYTRIDGTMNTDERSHAMRCFGRDRCDSMNEPKFILCSMHACGTGINLTRGNVAFLMDPWWNVAAENQAMDRVHRLGQTRDVRVFRLLMDGSMEERLVKLQDAKAALGKGSLEKLSPIEKRRARITALKDLFEIADISTEWTNN